MGRSVSVPSGAVAVAYTRFTTEYDSDDWDGVKSDWSWFCSDYIYRLEKYYPSLCPDDTWLSREDNVLMSNQYARFGVSEYCGLVAFWIVPQDDMPPEDKGRAQAWLDKVVTKFGERFGTLRKLVTASNGESFFEEIKP